MNSSSDARPNDRSLRLWSIHDICRSSEPEASTSSNDAGVGNEAAACSSQRPLAWTNSTGNVLPVPEIRVIPNTPERDRLPSPSSDAGVDSAPIQPSKVEEDESAPVVEQVVENDSRAVEECELIQEVNKTPSPTNVENNNNIENQPEPSAEPTPEIQANVESVNPGSQTEIVQENETGPDVEFPAEVPVPEKQTDSIETEKIENSVLSNSCESDNEVKVETNDSPTPSNENTTCLVKDEICSKEEVELIPEPEENAIKNESEPQPEISNVPDGNAEKMDVVENELEPSISDSKTEDVVKTCNEQKNEKEDEIAAIKTSDNQELSTDEKPAAEDPSTDEKHAAEDPLTAIKTDDDPLSPGEGAPKAKSKKKKKRRFFQKKDPDDSADVKADDKDSGTDSESPMKKEKRGSNYIPAREVQLLGVNEVLLQEDGQPTVRQSRRIAQLRLKEDAERRRLEEIELENYKKRKNGSKKKPKQTEAPDDDDPDESDDDEEEKAHRRKEKKYKKFDAKNPWLNSTDSSSQEEEEEDEIEEEPEEVIVRSGLYMGAF